MNSPGYVGTMDSDSGCICIEQGGNITTKPSKNKTILGYWIGLKISTPGLDGMMNNILNKGILLESRITRGQKYG